MPPDSGLAFIVVSHLARDYPSLLPEIVARHARMPVTAALDGQTIEPNTVYICPPNHILRVEKRTLRSRSGSPSSRTNRSTCSSAPSRRISPRHPSAFSFPGRAVTGRSA
jgi:two-component system CheB/CheR fusion protein